MMARSRGLFFMRRAPSLVAVGASGVLVAAVSLHLTAYVRASRALGGPAPVGVGKFLRAVRVAVWVLFEFVDSQAAF